tara:strand:- start:29 stop:934 length:906 start_codon:yes stop_codon:yes gene_type:complete
LFAYACIDEKQNTSIALSVEIDTLQTTIGYPISYRLNVSHPDTNLIDFPNLRFKDNLQLQNSSFSPNRNNFEANLELVFWDTGYIVIPEIEINILNLDSVKLYSINSDSIIVEVVSVKEKNMNLSPGSDGILPIKGPVKVQTYEDLYLALKIITLAIIAYGIISLWKKRSKKELEKVDRSNYVMPTNIALMKLEKLKQFELSSEVSKKDFFVKISLILREYIENSFFIRALEMTTEDISDNYDLFPFDSDLVTELTSILQRADMVKYAREKKDREQCMKYLKRSISFVKISSKNLIYLGDA